VKRTKYGKCSSCQRWQYQYTDNDVRFGKCPLMSTTAQYGYGSPSAELFCTYHKPDKPFSLTVRVDIRQPECRIAHPLA